MPVSTKVVIEKSLITDKSKTVKIEMELEEYMDFIKGQATTLGIINKTVSGCDFGKAGADFSILTYPLFKKF